MKPFKDNPILNNPYNKSIYTTVVGLGLMVIFKGFQEFGGISISTDFQMYVIWFGMALTTLIVPNKGEK